jgi:uncharacterized zinc-type alcohol dehydrogenase-like protein
MDIKSQSYGENNSRRKFIQQTALLSAGLMLPIKGDAFADNTIGNHIGKNIKSRGYAARDSSGKVSPWTFERRPVGDNDILIDIKFSSICHSDIHQLSGHWGPQQYPQVPGHEMAGIVSAVGKNVTKFNTAISMQPYGLMVLLTRPRLQELHKEVMLTILS